MYGREKTLRYFRHSCEAAGLWQARQITRAVILNYQGHLFHYRKGDGSPLAVGTQKQWLTAVTAFFSWLTREAIGPLPVEHQPTVDGE